ncbi:MAG: hypothetical protein RLZZ528_2062 [Pseudomonadota bacterium]
MFDTAAVRSVCYYRELPVLSDAEIVQGLNAGLAAFGLSFALDPLRPGEAAAMTNGAMRVAVIACDHPTEAAAFVPALTASYTRIRPNDYAARVAAHTASLAVEVSDVRSDRTLPIPETTLVVVCHAALVALITQGIPLVVHWQQSDMLVLPSEIPAIRGIGFPVSLVTRPEVIEHRPDPRGRVRFGVTAARSEMFFGKTVRVEPTVHPMPDVLSLIDFCILRRLAGEDLLVDGATLGLPGPVEVTVRHVAASERYPSGLISLSVKAVVPRSQPMRPFSMAEAVAKRRPFPFEQPRLKGTGGSDAPKAPRSGRP